MKKPAENSLTNKIFDYLVETSKNLFDLSLTVMFDPGKLTKGMGIYTNYNNYTPYFSKKIANLKASPYFIVKDDKFYLSTKGRIEIIKSIIKNKKKIKKWDGKWIAIIFDIPEATRHERNFLRRELKWMGFKELQHSVWIFPFDIEQELLTLLKLWKKDFRGDIRFMKIDKITEDADIKQFFDL